jgi:hypothetical protein
MLTRLSMIVRHLLWAGSCDIVSLRWRSSGSIYENLRPIERRRTCVPELAHHEVCG